MQHRTHSLLHWYLTFSRDGIIRHVMPAVDLSYDGGAHRNRGMCSVPRAHSWIDFALSLDEWENYNIVVSAKDSKEDKSWKNLGVSSKGEISRAIERATIFLSGDAPDRIGSGSHILHVILNDETSDPTQLECPRYALRATMDDEEEYASGVLDVVVSSIMAGSGMFLFCLTPLGSLRNLLTHKISQNRSSCQTHIEVCLMTSLCEIHFMQSTNKGSKSDKKRSKWLGVH